MDRVRVAAPGPRPDQALRVLRGEDARPRPASRRLHRRAPGHPVFAGLDAAGFRAAVRGGGSEGDRRQLRNFATRHLLPGARFNATADACAPDVLAAALAVLPRYAAVLNLADLPGESYFVLGAVVGLEAAEPPRAAAPETAAAYAKARGYDLGCAVLRAC